ncbi:MAG: BatA domain-containing protein [Chloroflexi bacterium]|nr:BatA domain-containing protein [Chloroflexota bacterium]
MLQFAAPLGLLAVGALVVPLVLHLVRQPLQVVRVGRLPLTPADRRDVRTLRWHEPLLLALRCALLTALALSLAGLHWQPRAPAPARWLLFIPGTALDAPAQAEWRRLRAEGYEARVLSAGFPPLADAAPPAATGVEAWSLLREADMRLPAGSQAVVFGPTWASQFHGARPLLSRVNVRWRATAGSPPMPTAAPLPPRVAIVAGPDREEDARYLRAALHAIGAVEPADDAPDWIFQLGRGALPPTLAQRVEQGAHLVTDASDRATVVAVRRWFDARATSIALRERTAADPGVPVLCDSTGEPLLTEERVGNGWRWRFALRFHPDWTDWPLRSAFPAWWRDQINPRAAAPTAIAPEQAAPAFAATGKTPAPALSGFGRIDLRGWCWLLAAVLFAGERWLGRSAGIRKALA